MPFKFDYNIVAFACNHLNWIESGRLIYIARITGLTALCPLHQPTSMPQMGYRQEMYGGGMASPQSSWAYRPTQTQHPGYYSQQQHLAPGESKRHYSCLTEIWARFPMSLMIGRILDNYSISYPLQYCSRSMPCCGH